jgi:hypothetical protein
MAKHPHADLVERLRKAHLAAAQKAREALDEVVFAATKAIDEGDGKTHKLLKKREARVLKAAQKWHRAVKDLAHHLRKKKA